MTEIDLIFLKTGLEEKISHQLFKMLSYNQIDVVNIIIFIYFMLRTHKYGIY